MMDPSGLVSQDVQQDVLAGRALTAGWNRSDRVPDRNISWWASHEAVKATPSLSGRNDGDPQAGQQRHPRPAGIVRA